MGTLPNYNKVGLGLPRPVFEKQANPVTPEVLSDSQLASNTALNVLGKGLLAAGTSAFGLRALKGIREVSRPQLETQMPIEGPVMATVRRPGHPDEEVQPQQSMLERFGLAKAAEDQSLWNRGVNAIRENVIDPVENNVPFAGSAVTSAWGKPWLWTGGILGGSAAALGGWSVADKLVKRQKARMRQQELQDSEQGYLEALRENQMAAKTASAEPSVAEKLTKVAEGSKLRQMVDSLRDGSWIPNVAAMAGSAGGAAADVGKGVWDAVSNSETAGAVRDAAQPAINMYHGPIIGGSLAAGTLAGYAAHNLAYRAQRGNDPRRALREALNRRRREMENQLPQPVQLSVEEAAAV